MSKTKIILIATTCGLLSACSSASMPSGARYNERGAVTSATPSPEDAFHDKIDRKYYNAYEEREPCQNYRQVPRGAVEQHDCLVKKAKPVVVAAAPEPAPAPVVAPAPVLLPIIKTYTVYFDLNSSVVRKDATATLNEVAGDIEKYKPTQVTVTGFTDTSGTASYNQALSEKRAHAVSKTLEDLKVPNQEVNQQGRGESDLAVPTKDGVKLPENRRVVVDFRAMQEQLQPTAAQPAPAPQPMPAPTPAEQTQQ